MKITKSKLKQLIKEELQHIVNEQEDAAKASKIANPPAEFKDTARVVKSEEEAKRLGDGEFEGTYFFFKKPDDRSGRFEYFQMRNGKRVTSGSEVTAMKAWRGIRTPIPAQTSNPYIKMLGFTTNLGRAIGNAMDDGDVLVVDMREAFSETEPVDYDKLQKAAEKSKRKSRRFEKPDEDDEAIERSQRRRQALRYRGS